VPAIVLESSYGILGEIPDVEWDYQHLELLLEVDVLMIEQDRIGTLAALDYYKGEK